MSVVVCNDRSSRVEMTGVEQTIDRSILDIEERELVKPCLTSQFCSSPDWRRTTADVVQVHT